MQRKFEADDVEFGTRYEPARGNTNRVQLAVQAALPEAQEFLEYGKLRRQIEILPDEALQHHRMVGQAIEDFRGGQTIAAQLLLKIAHPDSLTLRPAPIVPSRVEQKIEAGRCRVERNLRQHSCTLSASALVPKPWGR